MLEGNYIWKQQSINQSINIYKGLLLVPQYYDTYFSQNKRNIRYDTFRYAKLYHSACKCNFLSPKSLSMMGWKTEN